MSGGLWKSNIADNGREPPKIDTSVPHVARVYDYWLGGKNNFAADRETGEEAIRAYPGMRSAVQANRAFLKRSVQYLTEEVGIRQFLDVGTGLPSASNTHEVAQAAAPDSRIVYVDNDPIVLAHARALLTSDPQGATGYLDADARDTGKILTAAAELLDFSQPVALMLLAILQLMTDDDDPYQVVARLTAALPSGSFLVITHVAGDMGQLTPGALEAARLLSELLPQRVNPRNQAQVTKFFDGLELVEPGVVPVQQWRPVSDEEATAQASLWGGVARKP
jgi:hypothetical protein